MNKDELEREIKAQGVWYHNIDINGVKTMGDSNYDPSGRLEEVKDWLPTDLRGKNVLDIGSNAGAESFYCESLGAETVVGVELGDLYIKQAWWAKEKLNSKVQFLHKDIEKVDIDPSVKFDYILCLAFIYHVENPILVLRKIYDWLKNDGTLVLEIQYIKHDGLEDERLLIFKPYPAALFMPSKKAMESMLEYTGFTIEKKKEILTRRIMYYCKRK